MSALRCREGSFRQKQPLTRTPAHVIMGVLVGAVPQNEEFDMKKMTEVAIKTLEKKCESWAKHNTYKPEEIEEMRKVIEFLRNQEFMREAQ